MVPLQILPKPQLFDLTIERKPYLIDILNIFNVFTTHFYSS
jgi:hypothetical protein